MKPSPFSTVNISLTMFPDDLIILLLCIFVLCKDVTRETKTKTKQFMFSKELIFIVKTKQLHSQRALKPKNCIAQDHIVA